MTISLPEALACSLAREARRRGESVSSLVRQAIALRLSHVEDAGPLPFVGIGRSGRRSTARDAERILAREWSIVRDR